MSAYSNQGILTSLAAELGKRGTRGPVPRPHPIAKPAYQLKHPEAPACRSRGECDALLKRLPPDDQSRRRLIETISSQVAGHAFPFVNISPAVHAQ